MESALQSMIHFRLRGDRISYGFAECSLRKKKRISSFYSVRRVRSFLFSSMYISRASHSALLYALFSYFMDAIALNLVYRSSGTNRLVFILRVFFCFIVMGLSMFLCYIYSFTDFTILPKSIYSVKVIGFLADGKTQPQPKPKKPNMGAIMG